LEDFMNRILKIFILLIINTTSVCWGFSIIEPKTGAVYYPGDNVVIKAEPSLGENIQGVFFAVPKMGKGTTDFYPPYEFAFTIDSDFIGTENIIAIAKMVDGTGIEAEVQIKVILPSNITLQGIKINPDDFILLKKLPPGSDSNKVRAYETTSIGVFGIYSDGVKREEITSSVSGTTYTSSDENIVKVDKEGKVTAQGIGKAKITVRNGSYSAVVDVIVKPYGN